VSYGALSDANSGKPIGASCADLIRASRNAGSRAMIWNFGALLKENFTTMPSSRLDTRVNPRIKSGDGHDGGERFHLKAYALGARCCIQPECIMLQGKIDQLPTCGPKAAPPWREALCGRRGRASPDLLAKAALPLRPLLFGRRESKRGFSGRGPSKRPRSA
jgi:hypothetical protein